MGVGSKVDGVVTNSSAMHGVFFNFGCIKDGKLNCPTGDWKKYHVGDEVKGMIVNKVDIKEHNQFIELILISEDSEESPKTFEACKVAQRAVSWMSSPEHLRGVHFSTLADLWGSVVALEVAGMGFKEGLELLGKQPPSAADGVRLVLQLLGKDPSKQLVREALNWLALVSPEDAVQLWPKLFSPEADAHDVQSLLTLCETNSLDLPALEELVTRGFSDDVINLFAASTLPEARLVVVQSLAERHCKFEDLPPALEKLSKDPCEIVTVAARNLLLELKDPEKGMKEGEQERVSDSETDEDDVGADW